MKWFKKKLKQKRSTNQLTPDWSIVLSKFTNLDNVVLKKSVTNKKYYVFVHVVGVTGAASRCRDDR